MSHSLGVKVALAQPAARARGAAAPPRLAAPTEDPGPMAPRTLPLPCDRKPGEGGMGLFSIRLQQGRLAPGAPTEASTGRAAAKILRDPPHGFDTMDAFGRALGWGVGPNGNATSFERRRTITREDVAKLGVSLEEATRIRDAYRAVVSLPKGASNPNALGRALLLGRVVELLAG